MIIEWHICVPGALVVASGVIQILMACFFRAEIDDEYQLDDDEDAYGNKEAEAKRKRDAEKDRKKKGVQTKTSKAGTAKKAVPQTEMKESGASGSQSGDVENPWGGGGRGAGGGGPRDDSGHSGGALAAMSDTQPREAEKPKPAVDPNDPGRCLILLHFLLMVWLQIFLLSFPPLCGVVWTKNNNNKILSSRLLS